MAELAGAGDEEDPALEIDELEDLHSCLRTCKMGTKSEIFAAAHGVTCLTDLSEVTIVQSKELIKMFNDQQTRASNKLGGLHINRLAALIYWMRDSVRRQQPVIAADWTTAKMKLCIALVESLAGAADAKKSTAKIPPINMDLGFFKWKITILTKIGTIPSMDGVQSVLYVAREDKPATWNAQTDAVDDAERLRYQVQLSGPVFIADNKAAWVELEPTIIDTAAWAFVDKTQGDFRKSWLTILSICEGNDHMNKRIVIANNRIGTDRTKGGLVYQNEYTYSIVKYGADLLEAYDIIGRYHNEVAPETMVMRLLSGIVGPTATMTLMIIAIAHIKDHLLNDFNGTVTYLSMKCTELFPPKLESGGPKLRGASQARAGSNDKKGLKHRDIDGKKVPYFNGINVSNVNESFSRSDFTALGQEGRAYVNNRRPGGRYDGRSRSGGGGRGRGRGGHHGGMGRGGGGRDERNVQQAHYHGHGYYHNDDYGYDRGYGQGGGYGGEVARGGGEHDDRDVQAAHGQRVDDREGDGRREGDRQMVPYEGRGAGREGRAIGGRGGRAGGGFGRGAYGGRGG